MGDLGQLAVFFADHIVFDILQREVIVEMFCEIGQLFVEETGVEVLEKDEVLFALVAEETGEGQAALGLFVDQARLLGGGHWG